MMKKLLLIVLFAVSILALIWLIYSICGHSLIKSIYHGQSFGFLNKLISRQDIYGLDYYLNKGNKFILFYSAVYIFTVIFSLPLVALFLMWRRCGKQISPSRVFLGFAAAFFLWFSLSAIFFPLAAYQYGTDYWEYSATIKEWSANLWNPKNPHLDIETGSPRFSPIFFLLAATAKLFNLSPIQTMGLSSILNTVLLLGGIFLFFRIYFENDWAPVVGLVVLLSGWGIGWQFSNVYQLRNLFFHISNTWTFAFALSLYLFWLTLKILTKKTSSLMIHVLLGLLVFLIILSHPPSSAFAIGSFLILIFTKSKASFMTRTKLIFAALMGLLAIELWPYLSMRRLIAMLYVDKGWPVKGLDLYKLNEALLTLGPALLGIPLILYFIYKKKHPFIFAGFFIMICPYFLNILYFFHSFNRYIFYAVFYLHLALVWAILQLKHQSQSMPRLSFSSRSLQGILYGFFALFFGWNITLAAMEFAGFHIDVNISPKPPPRYATRHPVVSDMKKFSKFIPEDAVVLAPLEISWPLPSFSGKVIAVFHSNPLVQDVGHRFNNNKKFFSKEASWKERMNILKHYQVTHVLYKEDQLPKSIRNKLNRIGVTVGKVKNYLIVELFSYKPKREEITKNRFKH